MSAANEFDKLGEKPKIEQSRYLNEQLTQITKDLIGKGEEYVVPEMEYRFGKLGFKFEEAEGGRDYMNVTASNGKTTQISLDNFLESTSSSEAFRLQKFIQDNTPMKGLFVLEKTLREQDKTFNNQKEVDDEIAKINQEATSLNEKQKDFLLRKDAFEKEVEEINKTPESEWNKPEFIKKVNELEKKRESLANEFPTLLSEEESLTKKSSELDRSIGKYVSAKAKQGTWYGGIGQEILAGFGSILADAQGRFIDITTEVLPTGLGMGENFGRNVAITKAAEIGAAPPVEGQSMDDWKSTLTEEQLDAWEDEVDDAKKKFLKRGLQPAAREGLQTLSGYVLDRNTTPEWINLTKEDFWGGAILGLARSLPAMIGRGNPAGWVQRTSQMYAQVSDGLMQEMEKDPAFANISEFEKSAIIAPIGLVSSVLEAYGLRNVLQSKGVITSITMSVLGKAGKGATYTSLRELAENEIKSRIAKGTLVITAAGLAEAETGAAQQLAETGFKSVYNKIKEEELFKTPESVGELLKQVAIAGGQEAVGGFILGVPNAIGAAYSKAGFLKMDDKTFETFENMANDETLQSAYITSLKQKIANGRISASDAKQELQNYRTAVGVYRQLPDGLTVQQKKEAMNLLKERKDLEQYIQGKDSALVTPQQNRINEINQELSKIAEQGNVQKIQSEADNVKAERAAKIAELSKAIEDDDTATELNLSTKLPTDERQRIEKQLQDLKEEEASIQEQEVPTTPVANEQQVSELTDKISRIENALSLPDITSETEFLMFDKSYTKPELENELETLKQELNAIQEQAAGQVPVQPTAGVGQEVEQGVSQAEPQGVTEAGVQEEIVTAPAKPKRKADVSPAPEPTPQPTTQVEIEPTPAATAQPSTAPITITDIKVNFAPENAVEIEKGTREDTTGRKFTYNAAVTAQATDNNGIPIGFITKRANEDGTLSFTVKNSNGQNVNKGKAYPTERDARTALAEQVNRVRTKTAPAPKPASVQVTEEVISQDIRPVPKLVRDISVLITPATVRQATPLTKRIKTLSEKYDKLVKQFSKNKDKKTLDKIKETEAQILNDAKQEIIDTVSKIKGVSVAFGSDKRGLWDGSFEPSLNMVLSITSQADTKAVSKLLFDFAEKYSQDAFILESDSNFEQDVMDGKRKMPFTEFDEFGLMHYPQIIYTFDEPISDKEVADLSVNLQNNGIDAFSINNDEIKISVIKFFPEDSQLNETEQYEEREKDFDAKTAAAVKSTDDVFRGTRKGEVDVRIKKSSYQGAKNEGTEEQTREYDRSDVLEPFKEAITKTEAKTSELAALRNEQIKLQNQGKQLSKEKQNRLDELNKEVQPVVQKTFEVNKSLYEEAKAEVERIAGDAIKNIKASLSPFPIKRPERASVKTIRWYNSFTEKLGDGARVNIVVDNEADADKVFDSINKKHPVSKGDKDLRRIKETTELGYPKRLIEVRTPNGIIAEIQVITNEGYLAKDGLSGFTGDQKQKDTAKTTLNKIRERLGWAIPDGLGHYFYEIQRDVNVDDELRDEATRLSNLYYDAFTNPKSKLGVDFMDSVISFKKKVDSADKTNWDKGNEGRTPVPLTDYINQVSSKTQPKQVEDILAAEEESEGALETARDFVKEAEKFLDNTLKTRANDALLGIPLTVAQGIVKGIRVLLDGGIRLRDAIRRMANENNISEQKIKDLLDLATIGQDFNDIMARADDLINRQKGRGVANERILKNLEAKLRKEPAYINGTDAQRKIMEREVRAKMGAEPRKAASIGRVIGELKDITNVTREEKLKIIGRIRELGRDVAKDLAAEIRSMANTGKITAKQAASIIARTLNINPLNETSVSNFVDYMVKVFADAEYRDKIDELKGKINKAKKNITSKIGIADTLRGPLNKLLSINPILIPDAYLDRYAEIVDMLGASQQVLELEQYDVVKSDTEAILRAVNDEQSRAYELADILENSENKVFTKGGELDYAATLKEMVNANEITEEDADLMRKYKKEIVPQDEKQKMSEEEIKEKKKEAIDKIKASKITGIDGLPSQEEKDFADKFAELIKNVSSETLMKLGLNDLRNLSKVIDNINKNYLPSFAYQISLKIDGIKNEEVIDNATSNVSLPKISTAIGKIKSQFTKEGALYEAIRRIPLFFIDQALGLKDKTVFNALLLKTAEAEAKYKTELKRINSALEKAEQKVASSFSFNEKKLALSKMKMMTYMRQLEYESNQGSKQVNPALDYINKTIEHIEKQRATKKYGKTDLDNLKFIRSMYQIDGQINLEKLYKSFNQAEKDAINDIQNINKSLTAKAEFTANVIRGQVFNSLNNYLHIIVLGNNRDADIQSATDITNTANANMNPSTRARSLEERTKGAKPINFDVFASAGRGAKYVLLDYNLTGPIKTARITLNQFEKTLDERNNVSKVQRQISNSLTKAYNEAVDNLLINNIMDDTTADIIVEYIKRMGYRSVLAGTGRFTAELASNISFAMLSEPQAFMLGTKYANIIMSPLGPSVLENINSTQINRIFPEDSLSGNFMDTSAMKQRLGGGKLSDSRVINKIQQIWNLTGKRYTNGVEVLADNMISTPDKIVIRALWFGSFAQEFKKVSGKDVDFKLIGENNKEYLKENKEAIDKATEIADRTSVQAGATDNTFMGILKGASRPNQTIPTKIYNNFNSYMTRFLIFEFMSARTGVYAMMGDGPMSRTKGAMLLAAVATRMTVYSMLSKMLAGGIIELAAPLFGIEDEEEEEDDKTFLQSLGQAFIGSVGSLFFGRDFGNAVKMFVNFGLEKFNEEYLDFLREGEYDQYEDAIAYSIIPQGKEDKQSIDDVLFKLGGSFGPAAQTARLVGENILSGSIQAVLSGDTTKKEADAIERERRVVTQRIPLEILGNAGFIPLYKDVRTVVNKSIYADLKNSKSKTETPEAAKERFDKLEDLNELKKKTTNKDERKFIDQKILEIVGSEEAKASIDKQKEALKAKKESLLYDSSKGIRYRNESTMKRQNPALWRKRFGPNSDWDKQTKAAESVDSKLRKVREKREDKEYKEKSKRK